MKYIDFGIQTLIFGFALVLLATTWSESDWPLSVLFAQLFMGPWQFFSSLVSVITRTELYREKQIHLFTSIGYLMVLVLGANAGQSVPKEFVLFFATVPAWLLAIYYYYLTYRWAFHFQNSNAGFLRHINF